MPEAFKCSKCEGLFEGSPELVIDVAEFDSDVELCEECRHKMLSWFSGHEAKDLNEFSQEALDQS